MKKCIVFILAVFYLSSSSGITVHMHYCMDKMINWSLLGGEANKCTNCGMEKDGGCCKDESKIVKNTSDQRATENAIDLAKFVTEAVSFTSVESYPIDFNLADKKFYPDQRLSRSSVTPIYILNCFFRI